MFTLKEAADWLNLKTAIQSNNRVTGAAIDSRRIKPGMLFVACSGQHADGHDFLNQAARAGAAGALVEQGHALPELPSDFVVFACDSVILALQQLAAAYRKKMTYPVIAITGTNGKTTTKEMMMTVLSQQAAVVRTEGNYNNHLGVPLTLLNWPLDADFGIVEMGMNHSGEIKTLCAIARPTHGVITNVGEGHLANFKNLAGVAAAKAELLEALSDGIGFINGDDACLKAYRQTAGQTVTFGFGKDNHIHGRIERVSSNGCAAFQVEETSIQMKVPGRHNVLNGLAVSSVALAFGYGWPVIKKGLERFYGYDRRLNVMDSGRFCLIDDSYNANPSSMRTALNTLTQIQSGGRHVAILGDMLELGDNTRAAHEKTAAEAGEFNVDVLIGVGPEMARAAEGVKQQDADCVYYYKNRNDCIAALPDLLKTGDCILVKGSRGMQMEHVVSAIEKMI